LTACPAAEERLVNYGLLGPDARSISYEAAGAIHTLGVQSPWGAFLIVQPLSAKEAANPGLRGLSIGGAAGPGSKPITQVLYKNHQICRIPNARRLGGSRTCVRGRAIVESPAPSAAELAASVGVQLSGPSRAQLPNRRASLHWDLRLTFVAHVAVPDVHSQYLVELREPHDRACGHSERISPVDHDVSQGQEVHAKLTLEPACRGLWTGSVRFMPAGFDSSLTSFLPTPVGTDSVLVGRFSFRIPSR
jgi:hypothetical protein